jgi:hypothetical protein
MEKPLLFSLLIGLLAGFSTSHSLIGLLKTLSGTDGSLNIFAGICMALAAMVVWRIKVHVCDERWPR